MKPKNEKLYEWAAIAGIGAFIVALLIYLGIQPHLGGSGGTTTTSTDSSTSTSVTTTTEPRTPTTPVSDGPQPTFKLALAPNTYADLDHGTASEDGGRKYEVHLDFTGTRLFHLIDSSQENTWPSKYKIVDEGQYSYSVCERATHLVPEWFVDVSDLQNGNNLCVSTSEGRWAIMRLTGVEGTSIFSVKGVNFAVYLPKR